MDDLQERYDELDNIEITLRVLIDEITDEKYKEIFQELMYDAEDREREREYWASQF